MCIYLITKVNCFIISKYIKQKLGNQLERKIKILRFDRGGEYTFLDTINFCEMHVLDQVTSE